MSSKINNLLIPNVSQLPQRDEQKSNKISKGQESDFKKLLDGVGFENPTLKVSAHATKRLEERNIQMDGQEYLKLQDALAKLKTKGGHDSLVITSKAAYVLDVDKGMVVTAVDKNNMSENVFTKIDSTIFMN